LTETVSTDEDVGIFLDNIWNCEEQNYRTKNLVMCDSWNCDQLVVIPLELLNILKAKFSYNYCSHLEFMIIRTNTRVLGIVLFWTLITSCMLPPGRMLNSLWITLVLKAFCMRHSVHYVFFLIFTSYLQMQMDLLRKVGAAREVNCFLLFGH